MTRSAAALALGLIAALTAGGAGAQSGPLAACADPDLPPSTTMNTCRRALESGGLSTAQRAGVLVNLGVAEAALGRHRSAIASFSQAIETDPDLVQAYGNRARSLMAEGRMDEALADFDAALQRDATSALAWMGRATAHLRLDNAAAASSDLTRAIGLDPRLTAAYFNRGIASLMLDRPVEAAEDFSVVLDRDPEDAGAWLYRARARAAAGDGRALSDFERALALDPDWGRAHYALGLFHERRGETEAANAAFLRAYELGVEDRWLVERVQRIGRD